MVNTSHLCDSIQFDWVCFVRHKRKKDGFDILATGCRYDGLIDEQRRQFEKYGRCVPGQAAVGVSVALEKVANAIREDEDDLDAVSVAVSSLGQDTMVRAKADVVKGLRSAGVTSYLLESMDVSLHQFVTLVHLLVL